MPPSEPPIMSSTPPILRPLPRRPFELNIEGSSASPSPSEPASARSGEVNARTSNDLPPRAAAISSLLSTVDPNHDSPSRTRSVLNLTSSTLGGIFGPSTIPDSRDASEQATPWGVGAETPARRMSGWTDDDQTYGGAEVDAASLSARLSRVNSARGDVAKSPWDDPSIVSSGHARRTSVGGQGGKVSTSRRLSMFAIRTTTLFVLGTLYGSFISHLHDNRDITPVPVTGIDRRNWAYLAFWGMCAVAWGKILPWVDRNWTGETRKQWVSSGPRDTMGIRGTARVQMEWYDFVRGIGAFVGIAFAIRKLPWTSTTQASVTLSLANPVLWYLLDRTSAGLALSTLIGLAGTVAVLSMNLQLVPGPTASFSQFGNTSVASSFPIRGFGIANGTLPWASWKDGELVGAATWISSVLFCSCVCFGNVGRLGRKWTTVVGRR